MHPYEFKALRKEAQLSQTEMAEALGISVDSVSRMERGQPGYPIERRTQLAATVIAGIAWFDGIVAKLGRESESPGINDLKAAAFDAIRASLTEVAPKPEPAAARNNPGLEGPRNS